MSNPNVSMVGGGFFVKMLTVLFIGLKLTGHIDWSWWWVLSPLWITLSVSFLILLLVLSFQKI